MGWIWLWFLNHLQQLLVKLNFFRLKCVLKLYIKIHELMQFFMVFITFYSNLLCWFHFRFLCTSLWPNSNHCVIKDISLITLRIKICPCGMPNYRWPWPNIRFMSNFFDVELFFCFELLFAVNNISLQRNLFCLKSIRLFFVVMKGCCLSCTIRIKILLNKTSGCLRLGRDVVWVIGNEKTSIKFQVDTVLEYPVISEKLILDFY